MTSSWSHLSAATPRGERETTNMLLCRIHGLIGEASLLVKKGSATIPSTTTSIIPARSVTQDYPDYIFWQRPRARGGEKVVVVSIASSDRGWRMTNGGGSAAVRFPLCRLGSEGLGCVCG
jgi:hypothetical protein